MLNTEEEALPSSSKLATVAPSLAPPLWTAALSPLEATLGDRPGAPTGPKSKEGRQTIWNELSRSVLHCPGTLTASWVHVRLGFNPSSTLQTGLQTAL